MAGYYSTTKPTTRGAGIMRQHIIPVPSEKAYDSQASENGRRRAGAAAGSSCARPPWQATKVPPSAGYSSTCTLGYLAVYMKPKVNIERQYLTDDSKISQVCVGRNWLCVQAYSVQAFCMNMPGKCSSGSQAVQSDACLIVRHEAKQLKDPEVMHGCSDQ